MSYDTAELVQAMENEAERLEKAVSEIWQGCGLMGDYDNQDIAINLALANTLRNIVRAIS